MVNIELLLVSVLRALVEVAGFFLIGQALLYVLAGNSREKNAVYQLFRVITGPVVKAARFITPKQIVDKHVPVVAFFLLFWLWIGLAYLRRVICVADGLAC
ncbi:MAG: hypothetical protein L6Q60_08325 [Rhodocyclaceae bacterium]|nr:hypothetical protein [Rhodocyclaceae bacterium]